jgi:hypothetical protein
MAVQSLRAPRSRGVMMAAAASRREEQQRRRRRAQHAVACVVFGVRQKCSPQGDTRRRGCAQHAAPNHAFTDDASSELRGLLLCSGCHVTSHGEEEKPFALPFEISRERYWCVSVCCARVQEGVRAERCVCLRVFQRTRTCALLPPVSSGAYSRSSCIAASCVLQGGAKHARCVSRAAQPVCAGAAQPPRSAHRDGEVDPGCLCNRQAECALALMHHHARALLCLHALVHTAALCT